MIIFKEFRSGIGDFLNLVSKVSIPSQFRVILGYRYSLILRFQA